jgi:hypothetical protein
MALALIKGYAQPLARLLVQTQYIVHFIWLTFFGNSKPPVLGIYAC